MAKAEIHVRLTPALTPAQRNEVIQALYARLSETRHYLRSYEGETVLPHHDDCCSRHQAWIAKRRTERNSLREREEAVLGALHLIDPDDEEGR